MAGTKKFTDKLCKHTAADEENLLCDISEDKRLKRLGIDPDGDPIDILLALDKKNAELEQKRLAERAAKQESEGDQDT